jgi:hypothetical protein
MSTPQDQSDDNPLARFTDDEIAAEHFRRVEAEVARLLTELNEQLQPDLSLFMWRPIDEPAV